MNLFIIDWNTEKSTPITQLCKEKGHRISGVETQDGAEAYRKTATCKADAIVVNYAVKPSHGRMTAEQIHKRRMTSEIPIYFIGGSEDDNEKVEHYGICLSNEEFEDLLTS